MSVNAISAQGSKVYIGSGTGSAVTITAITKAFRAEVTGTHALSKGDRVTFGSVSGMVEINGLSGTVVSVTGTTSFVVDIDSRAFTTYTSGGTATPVTYTQINEVKDFKPSGSTVSDIDVTDLNSTAKEFRPGLVNNGDFSMSINYLATDAGQAACKTAFEAAAVKPFKIVAPNADTFSFLAYVQTFPEVPAGAVDGVLSGDIKIKISGAVTKS